MFVGMALAAFCISATAQTATQEERIKKLESDLAEQKARNDLFAARYPKFEGGKSGDVAGLDKLSGMALRHLPTATSSVGEEIATALKSDSCKTTVIASGVGMSDKLASATSHTKRLQKLQADVAKAQGGVRNFDGGMTVMALGALVSYASMFKSDYEVANADMAVDMDWLIAAIALEGKNYIETERFPDRQSVEDLIKDLDTLKKDAEGLGKKNKERKGLIEQIDALRAELFKPDDSGILPLVSTAMLSSITTSSSKCLAFISSAKASPLLLTKETIWGKGGKAFMHLPVQASVIQLNAHGKPVNMICKVATASAPIKLSALTNEATPSIPWSTITGSNYWSGDCDTRQPTG